jgi:hypothetical protein
VLLFYIYSTNLLRNYLAIILMIFTSPQVKGSHKRRSDELPKGSPNEKVARRESSLDDTNSDQKSAESDFLPETKSEALLQAPSSVSEV